MKYALIFKVNHYEIIRISCNTFVESFDYNEYHLAIKELEKLNGGRR